MGNADRRKDSKGLDDQELVAVLKETNRQLASVVKALDKLSEKIANLDHDIGGCVSA